MTAQTARTGRDRELDETYGTSTYCHACEREVRNNEHIPGKCVYAERS